LLIFPEGTNLTDQSKKKSNEYAAKQTAFNRSYEFCLHPRLAGFTYLINTMRKGEIDRTIYSLFSNALTFILHDSSWILEDILDTVDDITIGYEGDIPQAEIDLLKGYIPQAVHFHVQRHNVNDLPQTDKEIGQWLEQTWNDKEDRLNT
jgi:lysocardiolipin and lysophospholipid acyltransferase